MQPSLPILARYLMAMVQRVVGVHRPQLWTTRPQRWPCCKECGQPLARRRGASVCSSCRQQKQGAQQDTQLQLCQQCGMLLLANHLGNRCQRCAGELAQANRCLDCQAPTAGGDYCEPCRQRRFYGVSPTFVCMQCRTQKVGAPGVVCDQCLSQLGKSMVFLWDPGSEDRSSTAIVHWNTSTHAAGDTGDTGDTEPTDFTRIEQLLCDIYWTKEQAE